MENLRAGIAAELINIQKRMNDLVFESDLEKAFDPHQPRDDDGRWVKGARVVVHAGQYHGTRREVVKPLRGTVQEANDREVLVNVGSKKNPKWVFAPASQITAAPSPPERERLRHMLVQPRGTLSPLAERAVKTYTGGNKGAFGEHGAAEGLNSSLRRGAAPRDHRLRDLKDGLDEAFRQVPPLGAHSDGQPLITYRTAGIPHAKNFKPGDVITEPGFMSTSSARKGAEDFTAFGKGRDLYEIELPPGTRAVDINEVSGSAYAREREVLLPRGSRMEVISVTPTRDKRPATWRGHLDRVFRVRLIP